jgi:ankyrin repeat protein
MDTVQITLSNVYQTDDFGNTELHKAIMEKNMSKIKSYLNTIVKANRTDILNFQNSNGDTPLHLAVRNYPLHTIGNIILGLGADPTISNNNGEIIKIAESFKEYLVNTELDVNIDDNNENELSHLTILDSDTENTSSASAKSIMFPPFITIEEYSKPSLVNEKDAVSVVNTDSNMSLKDKTVKSFIENLLKSK